MTAVNESVTTDRAALTSIETAVLTGMSYGMTNRSIGRDLSMSEDAVKMCSTRMFRKLGARDRAHATRLGFERGYLTSSLPPRGGA
jgi:DNA-binding NarL/FixJ family response regulator